MKIDEYAPEGDTDEQREGEVLEHVEPPNNSSAITGAGRA